jgi:transcriptional regulator NrdR family protein
MIKCPKCQEDMGVIDTRDHSEFIRRRRECRKCGYRQTSFERIETKKDRQRIKFLKTYREMFPKDTRSDKKITQNIKELF